MKATILLALLFIGSHATSLICSGDLGHKELSEFIATQIKKA